MTKFKVILVSSMVNTLTKIVEANNKFEANSLALNNAKHNEWKIEDKLSSIIKKI